ncbi:MAG: divergent polysaccharide deacetylase family protein [Spirochaetales bacterium]|nr:divergent polysaccharide deacetylase family protein [Spirochaetales bacterium]
MKRKKGPKALILLGSVAVLLVLILFLIGDGNKAAGSRSGISTLETDTPSTEESGQAAASDADSGPKGAGKQTGEPTPAGGGSSRSASPEKLPEKPEPEATVALVIDDVGYSLEQLDIYLDLSVPMTFSILPGLPNTEESVERIREASAKKPVGTTGRQFAYMLHQPMEALGGEDPGPGAIYADMQPSEALEIFRKNLAQVPGAVGVNNHMGSKTTAVPELMQALIGECSNREIVFLDSLTTADSAAGAAARSLGVPILVRRTFLDNVREPEAIRSALQSGIAEARINGQAVLIGHLWSPELADVLKEEVPRLREEGVRFVPLGGLDPVLPERAAPESSPDEYPIPPTDYAEHAPADSEDAGAQEEES